MWTFKHIVAVLSIGVFVARSFLYLVTFGPVLDDDEFHGALQWAQEIALPDTSDIEEYPFSPITRAEASIRYVKFAQSIGIIPVLTTCVFEDLRTLTENQQKMILLSCQYGFFQGVQGKFYPDVYLTKSASIVALMRGLLPGKSFEPQEPYRDPYVTLAHDMGITKRQTGPYLEYLITQYELLLQLHRAALRYEKKG